LRIGVDGGGTKTECVLIDAAGNVIGRHIAPASNPSVVGTEQARMIVIDALCSILAGAKEEHPTAGVDHTLLCMAGSRTFWREFAAELRDFGRITTTDDSLPVLELATHGDPGLVLHAGTGSFVAARAPDGSLHYAGGLGWRFGDAGSAYDIGRRAIARALLETQGWAAPSRIGQTVRDHAQLKSSDDANALTRFFYHHVDPNRATSALAPAIVRLATEGDTAAHALVLESTGELVALATKVAAKLFPGVPLDSIPAGLSGPILTVPVIVAGIAAKTPLPLVPIESPAIEGVRRMLVRDARL
jgi:N-acetylglucosamine kinase-like BadF-type ATPase